MKSFSTKIDSHIQTRQYKNDNYALQIGLHENWRYKQEPKHRQRHQTKLRHAINQYGHNVSGAANTPTVPRNILTIAALVTMASVGAAVNVQPRAQLSGHRTANNTLTHAYSPLAKNTSSATTFLPPTMAPFKYDSHALIKHTQIFDQQPDQNPLTRSETTTQFADSHIPRAPRAVTVSDPILTKLNNRAEKALPNVFIQYVNTLGLSHNITDEKNALWEYVGKQSENKNASEFFFKDTQLQQFICQKLGLHYKPNDIYLKHLIGELLNTIIKKINFSQPKNGISYNGYAFQGLRGKSLSEAKLEALEFIAQRLNQEFTSTASTIKNFAELLLKSMDPVLSRVKAGDLKTAKIHYCNHQCGMLSAGVEFVEQVVGKDAQAFSIHSLIDIGRSYIKHITPPASATKELSLLQTNSTLSIRDRTLLKMASAHGVVIDLTRIDSTKQQLEAYFQALKDASDLAKAHRHLKQAIPTRRMIASEILRQKGLNPDQKIRSKSALGLGTGPADSKTLIEAYMDRSSFLSRIEIHAYKQDKDILNNLPELDAEFDKKFKSYADDYKAALGTSLKIQLQQLAGKENANQASFKLSCANMRYIKERKNNISRYSTGSKPIYDAQIGTEALFLEMKNKSGSVSHFVFTKKQMAKGWQSLTTEQPNGWALAHRQQLMSTKTLAKLEAAHNSNAVTRYRMTGRGDDPISISMQQIGSGNITAITSSAAKNFFDNNLAVLKAQAYEETELQQAGSLLIKTTVCNLPFIGTACEKDFVHIVEHLAEDTLLLLTSELIQAKLAEEAALLTVKAKSEIKFSNPRSSINHQALANELRPKYPKLVSALLKSATVPKDTTEKIKLAIQQLSTKGLCKGVCWNFVVDVLVQAKMISQQQGQTLSKELKVMAQEKSQLKLGDILKVRSIQNQNDFLKIQAGEIIVFAQDGIPKHVILSLGEGRFVGMKNAFMDANLGDGILFSEGTALGNFQGNQFFSKNANSLPLEVYAGKPVHKAKARPGMAPQRAAHHRIGDPLRRRPRTAQRTD